ncbi:MAG: electron transfer flavoprotein subunit alpha/FixB family protein [Phycisphaerae bacterium]
MTKDVLVFAEWRGGSLHPASLQCLTAAGELAASTGGGVQAAVIGHQVGDAAGAMGRGGAGSVFMVDHAACEKYNPLVYTRALAAIVERADPQIVLFPASFMGRDLAPRLAARIDAGLATDCTELRIEDSALVAQRPIYNGKAANTVHFDGARRQMVSVRPNMYPAPKPADEAGETVAVEFAPDERDARQVTREIVRTGGEDKDVTEASIVVSGGRSLKNADNFKMLYDLAHVLDGAVGASRAACDAGYQPHCRQVGLTGKTITPQLYMAFGISGAIQHLAGMRGSRRIVAVNTDAEAPIFKLADYGIVGDLFKIVPLLIEDLKKIKQG